MNTADKAGYTALINAVVNRHADVAALLLQNGADAKAANKDGRTALDAAKDLHFKELEDLLTRHGGK